MRKNNNLKKIIMWYKGKELWSKGLNKSQIATEVGLHRKTVRKYLQMSESEFQIWIQKRKNLPHKLQPYYNFVYQRLKKYPYLSAAQREDHLKEHFDDMPNVHSKTVYNFVETIRKEKNISKPKKEKIRQYRKLPEVGYGQEAQVDFGVYRMLRQDGRRQKVWLFAMVLSRSRQKFIYMQTSPFTTTTAIYAHQLAFEYFKGVPRKILYDQDRVFMVDENYGDLLLTDDFQRYVDNENFQVIFCRKADPETKGKVENVIKYVKINFLRGREFINLTSLNTSLLEWLKRTGNRKIHSTTRLVPNAEWMKEQKYLLPIKQSLTKPVPNSCREYKVLKDNTFSYRGNFYGLPLGTYQGEETKVLIKAEDDKLFIYDLDENFIISHPISILKGRFVYNQDYYRDKTTSKKEKINKLINQIGDSPKIRLFIDQLRQSKPRYMNDNFDLMIRSTEGKSQQVILQSLDYCIDNGCYNAREFTEIMEYFEKEKQEIAGPEIKINHSTSAQASIKPQTSNINDYESLFKTL